MTIARVNGSGWGVGDKLTSAQSNQLDLNGTYAYDIRSGQTATVQSIGSHSGPGRLITTTRTPADANTTYQMSDGISYIDGAGAALTADRTYTLSTTGAVTNDVVYVTSNPSFKVSIKDGNTLAILATLPAGLNPAVLAIFRFNGTAWKCIKSPAASTSRIAVDFIPDYATATSYLRASTIPTGAVDYKYFPASSINIPGTGLGMGSFTAGSDASGLKSYFYSKFLRPGIELMDRRTLASVKVLCRASGAHPALPGLMPALYLERLARTTVVYESLNSAGWIVDPSGSVVTYETLHDITFTPNQNNVIDVSTYLYRLTYASEGYTNGQAQTIGGIELNFI